MSEHIKQNRIVQLDSLIPHARNYRVHPQHQIDKLVMSLQRFGQGRSIVIQDSPEHPIIVAGHGIVAGCIIDTRWLNRRLAAKKQPPKVQV